MVMNDNPYSLDEREIKELLNEYDQCEGAEQESNMICGTWLEEKKQSTLNS